MGKANYSDDFKRDAVHQVMLPLDFLKNADGTSHGVIMSKVFFVAGFSDAMRDVVSMTRLSPSQAQGGRAAPIEITRNFAAQEKRSPSSFPLQKEE